MFLRLLKYAKIYLYSHLETMSKYKDNLYIRIKTKYKNIF